MNGGKNVKLPLSVCVDPDLEVAVCSSSILGQQCRTQQGTGDSGQTHQSPRQHIGILLR